jgi:lipopolysaccharide/colanic/teichoic acid biosynthesis glycosyltransferase
MRFPSPSSRGTFRVRLSVFDVGWAFASPVLALYLANAYIIFSDYGLPIVSLYCFVSVFFSLIAFLIFRVPDGLARYFSVHDALAVVKAAVCAVLMTCIVLFTLNRLDGIPRSALIIHALMLATGLMAARTIAHIFDLDSKKTIQIPTVSEHIIIVGSNRLSSLYIKMLNAYAPHRRHVIAVLDDDPKMFGRRLEGVEIVGAPQQLQPIIDEFAVHGIPTDRVIVGGEADLLSDDALEEVRLVCARREIKLDFLPRLVGLNKLHAVPAEVVLDTGGSAPNLVLPEYIRWKRLFDFFGALSLIVLLLPLLICVGLLALVDVGSPVLFWQQRLGRGGRTFLLYKFRTLRTPFDWQGKRVAEDQRLSWIGRMLRETRLDELPQLLNVLVGDMSLIGPRPLLPVDQPANQAVRLMVPPGITGWAQVHGANLLTREDKEGLDEWYVRNASLWLDLRIIIMTFQFALKGEHRSAAAFASAHKAQSGRRDFAVAKRNVPERDLSVGAAGQRHRGS